MRSSKSKSAYARGMNASLLHTFCARSCHNWTTSIVHAVNACHSRCQVSQSWLRLIAGGGGGGRTLSYRVWSFVGLSAPRGGSRIFKRGVADTNRPLNYMLIKFILMFSWGVPVKRCNLGRPNWNLQPSPPCIRVQHRFGGMRDAGWGLKSRWDCGMKLSCQDWDTHFFIVGMRDVLKTMAGWGMAKIIK